MGCPHYLAKTSAEFRRERGDERPTAWMACHFSPYGTGLSNLPLTLPPDSLLMVDDITPIHGHDPVFIGEQLRERVEVLRCRAVLLDFLRPGYEACKALAEHLSEVLPCPVGVSSLYGKGLGCPVVLSPPACSVSLEAHLAQWQGREIWMETALEGERIVLTEQGAEVSPLPRFSPPEGGFGEECLCCHYKTAVAEDRVTFTLWRTKADVEELLTKAEALGVTLALGLFQEWKEAMAST